MTKAQKVALKSICRGIVSRNPIPLDHKDPYTLLIAVLLSAQSTDVRVNLTTPHLFAKADNPWDMVK